MERGEQIFAVAAVIGGQRNAGGRTERGQEIDGGEGGDLFEAFEAGVATRHDLGAVDLARGRGGQDVDGERALA